MKITLLTASSSNNDYWDVLSLSAPNKLEYCLRHKIQLLVVEHNNYGILTNWGERELFILDALNCYGCDWLFFQGADTLITNMTVDVRSLLDPAYDVIIAVDINGINNDSMFFQNTAETREFLKRVLYQRAAIGNDQLAMAKIMNEMPKLRAARVNQRLFNSFKYDEYLYCYPNGFPEGTWQLGDFVIHFPGMSNEKRLLLMHEYLNKVVR